MYGLHFVLCLLVCLPLGLDLVLAYLVANISNPLVAPFLITLEVEIGSLLSTGQHAAFSLERARQTGILGFVFQAALGSIFVGAALAALGSAIAYVDRAQRRATEPTAADDDAEIERDAAMQRTIRRYRAAPIGDRIYVAAKLNSDPLTRLLGGAARATSGACWTRPPVAVNLAYFCGSCGRCTRALRLRLGRAQGGHRRARRCRRRAFRDARSARIARARGGHVALDRRLALPAPARARRALAARGSLRASADES